MKREFIPFLFLLFLNTCALAQPKTDAFLTRILATNNHSVFKDVMRHPDTYRLQIIYTQINRDKKNRPTFTNYYFNYAPNLYFNPASMVKMPTAFLALEKLNILKQKGIDKNTTVLFDSSETWQHPLYRDTSARSGLPSMAHFIKRAFLISGNDPYNRLYQFVGQGDINRSLHKKSYLDARITRQFLGLTEKQNRHTPALRFVEANGATIYA